MRSIVLGMIGAVVMVSAASAQMRYPERYDDNVRTYRSLDGFRPVPERYDLHYGPGGYWGSGVRPSRPPPGPSFRRCVHVYRGMDRNTNLPIYVQECN